MHSIEARMSSLCGAECCILKAKGADASYILISQHWDTLIEEERQHHYTAKS